VIEHRPGQIRPVENHRLGLQVLHDRERAAVADELPADLATSFPKRPFC
jgi:hypothetical protein